MRNGDDQMSDFLFRVKDFAFVLFCLAIVNDFATVLTADANCKLLPVNDTIQKEIKDILSVKKPYFIRYHLQFPKNPSPLIENFQNVYKADLFNRVSDKHGQKLLSLAFNYGVISLSTLNLGTDEKKIDVFESPDDCLHGLSENATLNVVLYLLARDFGTNISQPVTIHKEERICVSYINARGGIAYFEPRCFKADTVDSDAGDSEVKNVWIEGLYILVAIAKVLLIAFGPRLFIGYVANMSQESAPYIVKLKEPLMRTLFIARNLSDFEKVRGLRVLNLSHSRGYPKLKQTLETAPFGRPFQANISQYDILAPYDRLIKENEVPVTFWRAIAQAIFRCKVKNIGPMQSCCYVDMCRDVPCVERRFPWVKFWSKFGIAIMILFLPFLYYLRLVLFYVFEVQELDERNRAAKKLDLAVSFDNSLIHYLRPNHPVFLTIYAIYFGGAVILAFLSRADSEGRLRSIIVGSFNDLHRLSYLKVFQLIVENLLWPFKRYGILGCCLAIVYWPIAFPLTLIVYIFYSIPTIYLSIRMLFYSRRSFLEQVRMQSGIRKYQKTEKSDTVLKLFQADFLFGDRDASNEPAKLSEFSEEVDEIQKFRMDNPNDKPEGTRVVVPGRVRQIHIRPTRLFQHLMASMACILALYALLIIVAESLGSVVEIIIFTLMGIIANADTTVRYVALIVLLIVYTYDCFNNVQLRYFKLNKALFLELKGRVAGLDTVTALPSYLQENQAFKAQEQSAQAAHEKPDNIAEHPSRHWFINDLVLFVDNEDTFRIPRRLFTDVCEIQVSGVPGPVYKGVIEALQNFVKMVVFVLFVFFIVLAFGDIYELSNTTQMMAIVSSGFLPILLKQFMEPRKPDIEINTLSFKSKLDEVVKNFWQLWPVHDFTFTPIPDPEPVAVDTAAGITEADKTKNEAPEAKQTNENPVAENRVAEDVKNKATEANLTNDTSVAENKVAEIKTENQVSVVTDTMTDVGQTETALTPPVDLASEPPPSSARKSILKFFGIGGSDQTSARASTEINVVVDNKTDVGQTETAVTPATDSASEPRRSSARKSILKFFGFGGSDETPAPTPLYHVDLLIQLPERYEDLWVDGWSNIIEVDNTQRKHASEVAESMKETAEEKIRARE